jgi:hypothetical protein
MKKLFITSAAALLFSVAAIAQTPAAVAPPPVPVQAVPTLTAQQLAAHPEIAKALNNLHLVEQNLMNATDTYQGHKQKALDLLKQAETELVEGVINHK